MENELIIQNFGHVPSPKDKRDFKLGQVQAPVAIPETFRPDYSSLPTYHQGKTSACIGHAVAWMINYNEYIEKGSETGRLALSPRMIYALCKRDDGIPDVPGTYYRQGLKEVQDHGICRDDFFINRTSLTNWEYIDTKQITPAAYSDAEPRKIRSYVAVDDLSWNGLKQAIYQNKVVLIGMHVGASFWSALNGTPSWAAADILPLRLPSPIISGHAVVAIGYDKNYIYFKNSFGPTWGESGSGYFGKNYMSLVYEAWTEIDLPDEVIVQIKQAQITLIDKLKQYIFKVFGIKI